MIFFIVSIFVTTLYTIFLISYFRNHCLWERSYWSLTNSINTCLCFLSYPIWIMFIFSKVFRVVLTCLPTNALQHQIQHFTVCSLVVSAVCISSLFTKKPLPRYQSSVISMFFKKRLCGVIHEGKTWIVVHRPNAQDYLLVKFEKNTLLI